MEYIHHYHSPLGGITVASDGEVLTGLWFDGQKYFAVTLAKEHEEKMLPVFEETDRWLDIYFQGKEPDFLPPVSFASGSEFRQEVWKILLSIPYGKTMTYGEIAACIAKQRGLTRMSAQAVGGAVGHNPISIIVPCHRVVGTDGSLTGYAGGIDKKIKLLEEHKSNNIDEIRLINRIYDKFHVISSCILFFDSIDGINKQCGKSDSRKLQYTTFVIFKDVYVQTALWLNNKTYWEVRASWQLVEDFEFVINKFFLKTR